MVSNSGILLIMGEHQFGNRNGNIQSPFNTINSSVPDGRSSFLPMTITQPSALNIFVMGPGHSTINFGFCPSAQRAMEPQNDLAWTNTGVASTHQESQLQQQPSYGATGTIIPQSGNIKNLRKGTLSPGAAIHPNKLAAPGQDPRRLTSTGLPPVTHSPQNPNSPVRSERSNDNRFCSPSPADLMKFSP